MKEARIKKKIQKGRYLCIKKYEIYGIEKQMNERERLVTII